MDKSVAEGNSTSLQTCLPHDPGLFSPENLPSPLSFSVHVNDLGLTPSPGSQQHSATQDNHSSGNDHEISDVSTQEQLNDDHVKGSEGKPHGQTHDEHRDKTAADANQDSSNNSSHETDTQDLYDSLFDSNFEELDAAFESRKRTGDQAFPGFDFGPQKRRHVDLPQNPTPNETPSLSSPNSSFRPDPVETAPQTPGIDQTPDSFNVDTLFDEQTFPFEISDDLSNFEPSELNFGDLSGMFEDPALFEAQPSTSDITKQRFSLDDQDLSANTSSEVLQQPQEPQYLSPYPEYRGPLGYLPSTPNLHVKYVEVTEERLNYRMESYKSRISQLTTERNKYRNAWNQWATVDRATGKTKDQILREEMASIRRVSSQHQRRVEEYKAEAEDWKSQLHNVATLYNNLLYDIQVRQRMPTINPAPGYRPRQLPGTCSFPAQPQPVQQSNLTPQPAVKRPDRPMSQPLSRPQPASRPPSQAPTPRPSPAVTIDLTEDTQPAPQLSSSSSIPKANGAELLQSFKNKKYGWLDGKQMSQPGQEINRRPSHSNDIKEPVILDDDDLARQMEDELART